MNISVVIPAFNEEKHIKMCLDSIAAQTVAPYEVIVVDNNSSDSTAKIAKECGAKVVNEENQGIVFARNRGFNVAHGDVIARCDADTVLPKQWVEEISKVFKEKIAAVSGPVKYKDAPLFVRSVLLSKVFFIVMRLLAGHNILLGFNMALDAGVWQKIKAEVCMDGVKKHEDIDLSFHAAKHGKIVFDSKLIVEASARRIMNNPISFFYEYPKMLIQNFKHR